MQSVLVVLAMALPGPGAFFITFAIINTRLTVSKVSDILTELCKNIYKIRL